MNRVFYIEIIQPKFDELYRIYGQLTTPIKSEPVIKPKTLELIAREIGDLDSGNNLISFLTNCGVDRDLIEYPQTKWRMVYAVLLRLATSDKAEDKETLFKIVGDAVHPLMHRGDVSSAEDLLNKFNNYLSYDNGHITFDEEENIHKVYFMPTGKEREEILAESHAELEEEERKQREFLYQPENKEKISLLRKTYQALMGVAEVFCRNFSHLSHEDIIELNKRYLTLDKAVWGLIDELKLGGSFDAYKKHPRPFSNLFSAEKELGDIDWDVIRREMSARFGEIETLYQRVNASDILAEPDKQKQLNDIQLYLSELKEKTKESEEIDYTDTATRKAWERKWETIQVVWTIYESNGKPNSFLVPIERLTIENKNRTPFEIDDLLDGFKRQGFFDWHRGTKNYEIKNVNHNQLAGTYKKTGVIYRKFAKTYQERATEKTPTGEQQVIHKIEIVKGKMEVEGLQDGLKAIAVKKGNRNKFPYKLPAGTIWENFTIKFLDGENVFIQVKQFKHNASYKEMGFIGKGNNPNPSEAWIFMKILARVNGELTLKDPEARDKYKKQKEFLAKSLQDYFSLDYDPFYPYRSSLEKSGNSYKIKITLIPSPANSGKSDTEKDDDLGLKGYLDEQAPQVYEDE